MLERRRIFRDPPVAPRFFQAIRHLGLKETGTIRLPLYISISPSARGSEAPRTCRLRLCRTRIRVWCRGRGQSEPAGLNRCGSCPSHTFGHAGMSRQSLRPRSFATCAESLRRLLTRAYSDVDFRYLCTQHSSRCSLLRFLTTA